MAERTTITLGGDLRVGRIGYSAMRLTGPQVWGEYPDHDGGIALLRQALEAGVSLIDTADVYRPHANEQLIREALHPYPEDLVIATKGGFVRGGADLSTVDTPGGTDFSTLDVIGNRNYLRQCVYMSARRLGAEQIDLYYLHSGYAKDASQSPASLRRVRPPPSAVTAARAWLAPSAPRPSGWPADKAMGERLGLRNGLLLLPG